MAHPCHCQHEVATLFHDVLGEKMNMLTSSEWRIHAGDGESWLRLMGQTIRVPPGACGRKLMAFVRSSCANHCTGKQAFADFHWFAQLSA